MESKPAVAPNGVSKSSKKSRQFVKPRAYKLLWDSHSIVGIVIGIGLFVIFYCGAFTLYRADLMQWADPAYRVSQNKLPVEDVIDPIMKSQPPAEGADVLFINAFDERPYYWLRYETVAGDTLEVQLSATTGMELPWQGRSRLARIIYDLHFFRQAGTPGRILSGIVAVFFLFTLIGGLLIHLRKLPKDWHTFRPKEKLRTSLADAHTVLGLIGFPFTIMYAITGAFFSLLILVLAPTVLVVFDGDQGMVESLLEGVEHAEFEASGNAQEMLYPSEIIRQVSERWGDVSITSLSYEGWGDANAIAVVSGQTVETLATAGAAVVLAGTGEILDESTPQQTTALGKTVAVMTNLHFASFGGWLLNFLFFVLAIAASAVILTGNVLWILVRRPKDPLATPALHKFLGRLTIGAGIGLVAAIPFLMIVSRLLPIEMEGRAFWEEAIFFGSWLVLILVAFIGRPPLEIGGKLLFLAGILSVLVPISNGIGTGAWPWIAVTHGDWGVWRVDIGFFMSGIILFWISSRLSGGDSSPVELRARKEGVPIQETMLVER
ncbi:MAG: PepSY-associated TM helix domain-containing protein [Bacteroidota bacterium]